MSWEFVVGKCVHCGTPVLMDEGILLDSKFPKKYACDDCFESEMRSHPLTEQMEKEFGS